MLSFLAELIAGGYLARSPRYFLFMKSSSGVNYGEGMIRCYLFFFSFTTRVSHTFKSFQISLSSTEEKIMNDIYYSVLKSFSCLSSLLDLNFDD